MKPELVALLFVCLTPIFGQYWPAVVAVAGAVGFARKPPGFKSWQMASETGERHGNGRRWTDVRDEVARMKAEQALNEARLAREETRTHMAVCERDNEHIKSTLSKQDRMLNWIVGLIVTALAFIAALHIENLGKH